MLLFGLLQLALAPLLKEQQHPEQVQVLASLHQRQGLNQGHWHRDYPAAAAVTRPAALLSVALPTVNLAWPQGQLLYAAPAGQQPHQLEGLQHQQLVLHEQG